MHEEGTNNDILSCKRSLEDKNNKNVNEHYVHTLSIEKLRTKDLNEKNEDACATSIEVHIIPNENVDILPLPIKRSRRDYGKEPLRAPFGYPDHVMKTRTSRNRKPSKFKVSPFVHNLRKMVKRQTSESIPMSIREDMVDTQSFNVLQSLVADYVFNKALSKSELFVDFGHEHGVRGDFECLCPRQNLMDVVEFCQMFFKLYDIGKDVFQFSIDWAPLIPTQDNGWDCEVHVIKHMQRFKNGDSMTASDVCNSIKIHREIASDLVSHERNREKQTIVAIVCTKTSTRAMKKLLL
ncbi:hypothetical protein CK203_094430 [Vitis vinifera]|uniref:Ubiquitin-like protease family profile domain-containing protein n=1 Tax=Vitis vinifera TaxID=29760 RepID=A0A438CKY5_VITVI|nr:hypothetical protein CK203_094430 [Vitis vinifera]